VEELASSQMEKEATDSLSAEDVGCKKFFPHRPEKKKMAIHLWATRDK
jgi:hypothetical protein